MADVPKEMSMAKGSRSAGGRSTASSRGSSRTSAGSSATRSSNSWMWSQPATARQIAVLKSTGNFDGKYYSKGRAGQTIGESVRRGTGSQSKAANSSSTTFHPLIDEVLEHMTAQRMPAHTASTTEAMSATTSCVAEDPNIVLEEGTTMSELTVHRSPAVATITSVVATPVASVGATPFAYVPELVTTLLQPLVESTDPAQIRALEKALTIAKGTLAKSLTRARNELIGILRGAPSGVIASPEARADEILWSACSADLEQELLVATRTRRGRTHPSKVIDEMLAQVRHRVELAMIEATDMVETAKIQAALPPAPARGYEPCWGEVTGVKPFGAFILLPSGESGLLHVSEMHPLNNGRRLANATLVANVGQSVYVKVTSKNEKGQLNFALVSEA
ncbi:S1 RNA-binding domain-containing protein [Aeromicrobium phoceense]|uniref:S1 RNA-binding domain-containing protein n=1 Tax=Aeromicrobium phoceense TaxID=2754045 RepID=UPI0028A8D523|nr:S1 RNA-binding domain-containing protein [Aeromicrobium phoceense]